MNLTRHRAVRPQASGTGPAAVRVHGGRTLSGTVTVAGFKHSLVTVVAAAAASTGRTRITNVPRIVETAVLCDLLAAAGITTELAGDALLVDAGALHAAPRLTGADRIHGAIYLIPALVARVGRVLVPTGGGCRIGDLPAGQRPTDQYADILRRFGAEVHHRASGDLEVTAARLRGCSVDLLGYAADPVQRTGPRYSGATKMALLAAAVADGTSLLRHPYPKPDVTDLVAVLRDAGAEIEPDGSDGLRVLGRGPGALCHDLEHVLIPDLIEVMTWLCAGATLRTGGLRVHAPGLDRALAALGPELDVLRRMGVRLDLAGTTAGASVVDDLRATDVTVASHGVFSDSQPFLALLATHARGTTRITETVWRNRFGYLPGLAALGIRVSAADGVLTVTGPCPPTRTGQRVDATDLRSAAVLVLAALAVRGATEVTNTHHLARGYPDLPGTLRGLGADVTELAGGE